MDTLAYYLLTANELGMELHMLVTVAAADLASSRRLFELPRQIAGPGGPALWCRSEPYASPSRLPSQRLLLPPCCKHAAVLCGSFWHGAKANEQAVGEEGCAGCI